MRAAAPSARPLAPAPVGVPAAKEPEPGRGVEAPVALQPVRPMPSLEPASAAPADALAIPVVGVRREHLRDHFNDRRGGRAHEAIDIAAPRGTPVVAAIDGTIRKLFLSRAGGITVYQLDPSKQWIYYYAHLDAYSPNLAEGAAVRRGDVIGYVGTSGNSPPNAPHLHFAVGRLAASGDWWKSDPVNPYPLLMQRGVTWGAR